ncbi:MAG: hypothetical protein ACRDSZ_22250 [Pseudonocardiaceae bacterium]
MSVAIVSLLAAYRSVLTVEDHDDLGRTAGYVVADRHPQQREKREQAGEQPGLVPGIDRCREPEGRSP